MAVLTMVWATIFLVLLSNSLVFSKKGTRAILGPIPISRRTRMSSISQTVISPVSIAAPLSVYYLVVVYLIGKVSDEVELTGIL